MRTLLMSTALVPFFVILGACAKKQDDTPPPGTAATAYPATGYPPPQATYGQPYPAAGPPTATYSQYPAPPPTMAAPPAPAPAQAPPAAQAAPGQMAVPGPIAFVCQSDVPCGLHHCNLQYGKCAFPCQSAADCIPPNQCSLGLCIPSGAPH